MERPSLFSLRNPWFARSLVGILIIAFLAALVGFIWMPFAHGGKSVSGFWDAICRGAGAITPGTVPEAGIAQSTSSDVIVVPGMIVSDKLSIGRGATLALRCTMCHGARGMSEANTPNLAGQNAESIYKQLRDFQSHHRGSSIMAPHTENLGDQDMRDLAAYYAYLPRMTPPPNLVEQLKAPRIVQIGAPMRNIAPCASCHGGSALKTATPILEGEPASYIRSQLKAFANSERKNDIGGQMRNVARQMTPEEIETVATYYSKQ
jgi:cytochrome c553